MRRIYISVAPSHHPPPSLTPPKADEASAASASLPRFYLSAVLRADESSDGAEVVEVGAVQHPEQRLLGAAPLDHTALRRFRLAVLLRPQLGGSLAARVPLWRGARGKTLELSREPSSPSATSHLNLCFAFCFLYHSQLHI